MPTSWSDLLAKNRVQEHATSLEELRDLRAVVERDLRDAVVPGLSDDRRFATAYNAALQLCKMAIACAGYRVKSGAGHHDTTFKALPLVLGPEARATATYLDVCRRKRNTVDYDMAYVATATEADDLLQKVEALREQIEAWITEKRPELGA